MTSIEFGKTIENVIKRYDLLRHPFYEAWMEGTLTRHDLREYAQEYYHQVESFPKYLREFGRRLPVGQLKHQVLQNLCEELGTDRDGAQAHTRLWVIFAEGMGADPAKMRNRSPLPRTQQLIDIFFELVQFGSIAEALAALYAYESQVPALAAHKAAALRYNYGVDDAACEYFVLHSTADIRHANTWREQLIAIVERDANAAPFAIVAAQLAAKALWRTLDGINERRIGTVQ